jgi:nucleoside-triphosphatase
MKKMHIFLTGERGVGKSTVIGKLTDRLVGVRVGGFKTLGGPEDESGNSAVYIMPYGENADDPRAFSENRKVAARNRRTFRYESYAGVFDGLGAKLLRCASHCDLIVMDELGFMEADAGGFQKTVLSFLDGAAQVLGVVKPQSSPRGASVVFLDRVRSHGNVRVFEITPENRDAAPDILLPLLISP